MIRDIAVHGTPAGNRQGCKGRLECDPDQPWTCGDAMIRYRGDLTYRRRVDAGMTPQEIAAADRADVLADLMRRRNERRNAARKAAKTVKPKPAPREKRPARPHRRVAEHGTDSSYKRGCRGPEEATCPSVLAGGISCAQAHRDAVAAWAAGRQARPVPAHHHGTPYGYAIGCRTPDCPSTPTCTQARAAAETDRRRRKKNTTTIKEQTR